MRDIFKNLDALERMQKLILEYVEKGLTLEEASELIEDQTLALNGCESIVQKQNEEPSNIQNMPRESDEETQLRKKQEMDRSQNELNIKLGWNGGQEYERESVLVGNVKLYKDESNKTIVVELYRIESDKWVWATNASLRDPKYRFMYSQLDGYNSEDWEIHERHDGKFELWNIDWSPNRLVGEFSSLEEAFEKADYDFGCSWHFTKR